MQSPTARTLAECRSRGWIAVVTERWNPYAHVRQDLFGWMDVLALDLLHGIAIGIQTTSSTNHASRVEKVRELAGPWLVVPGHEAWVWSWSKKGPRGGRKLWTLREERVDSAPLPGAECDE